MSCRGTDSERPDLVRSRAGLLLWCLPAALIVLGALCADARPALWIPSYAVMGIACLHNARRCGRLHCHLTGPLFLLAALAAALDAFDVVRVGWPWILIVTTVGTAASFALELVRGLYVPR